MPRRIHPTPSPILVERSLVTARSHSLRHVARYTHKPHDRSPLRANPFLATATVHICIAGGRNNSATFSSHSSPAQPILLSYPAIHHNAYLFAAVPTVKWRIEAEERGRRSGINNGFKVLCSNNTRIADSNVAAPSIVGIVVTATTDGQGKKEGSVLEEAVLQTGERRPSLYCQKVGKFSGVEKGENGGSEGEKGYHEITENNGRQPPLNHWKGGSIRVARVMILT